MAQNDTFIVGETLGAGEMNLLPFGTCGYGNSSSDQNLTTTITAATGMSVTFDADISRLYKVTYFEPQVRGNTVSGGNVQIAIWLTSVAGTQLQEALLTNGSTVQVTNPATVVWIGTVATGSRTIIGAAKTSAITGTPRLSRTATARAYIVVEDIGAA